MHPSEDLLSKEPSLEHYKKEKLKKGGQGIVYKYTHPYTGKIYAVKVLEYDDTLDEEGNPKNMVYMVRESYVSPTFHHVCSPFGTHSRTLLILNRRLIYFAHMQFSNTKKALRSLCLTSRGAVCAN